MDPLKVQSLTPSMAKQWLKWMSMTQYLMWEPLSATWVICCFLMGMWQCHCCQMLCGLGKVHETLACPNHQIPLTQDKCQGVRACVCSAMLHHSKTWGAKEPETATAPLQCPCHDPLDLWHQIQGLNTLSFTTTEIGIEEITPVFHCHRLRWYGYVQRATSCIISITHFPLPDTRKKGRPCKTWSDRVKTDVGNCGLEGVNSLDRGSCLNASHNLPLTPECQQLTTVIWLMMILPASLSNYFWMMKFTSLMIERPEVLWSFVSCKL